MLPDLLYDVNLQQVPEDFLYGSWRVAECAGNALGSLYTLAHASHLQTGELRIQSDTQEAPGRWHVQRDTLLNRPYLELQLPNEVLRALITRLRRSTDGLGAQLTLYFQSGTELLLTRP